MDDTEPPAGNNAHTKLIDDIDRAFPELRNTRFDAHLRAEAEKQQPPGLTPLEWLGDQVAEWVDRAARGATHTATTTEEREHLR